MKSTPLGNFRRGRGLRLVDVAKRMGTSHAEVSRFETSGKGTDEFRLRWSRAVGTSPAKATALQEETQSADPARRGAA